MPTRFLRYNHLYIFCFAILFYLPVLEHDFQLNWDDQWVVINDFTESGLNFSNIKNIFFEFYHGQYAPINQFYYTVIYSIDGYNPLFFHLFSIVLHALNSILVSVISVKFFSSVDELKISAQKLGSITSLFFIITPVNIESVSWISASKIVLYSFFYLIATVCYLKFISHKKKSSYILSFFFYVISFGAKEQAVTFPFFMILIDWLDGERKVSRLLLNKLPFIAFSFIFGLITIQSQVSYTGEAQNSVTYNILDKVFLASYSLVEYINKITIPINLSYIYPFPFQPGGMIPNWLWIYPPTITLALFMIWKTIKHKLTKFIILFFVIQIIITLHFIDLSRHAVVADRYSYLATIAIGLFVALLVRFLLKSKHRFKSLYVLSIILYTTFVLVTGIRYMAKWKDSKTLKEEFIENIAK